MSALKSMLVVFVSFLALAVSGTASALTVEFDPCAAYNFGNQKDPRAYRECREHFAAKEARENRCEKTVVMTKEGIKTRSSCATK